MLFFENFASPFIQSQLRHCSNVKTFIRFFLLTVKLRSHLQHFSSTRSKEMLQVFCSKTCPWCYQQKLLQKFDNKQEEDDINKSANYSLYFSSS